MRGQLGISSIQLFKNSSLIASVTKDAFWHAEVLFLPAYADGVSNNGILYPDSIRFRRKLDVSSDFKTGRHYFIFPLTETEDVSQALVLTSPLSLDEG